MHYHCTVWITIIIVIAIVKGEQKYDRNGYILYCPCMGRFGNQVDHLLGALSFAKKLNRTLVVPPWIEHDYSSGYKNVFIPYSRWFKLEALEQYHKVIEMHHFMNKNASNLWPSNSRKIFCHRKALERSDDKISCPAKIGSPFGPFWDNFNINFAISMAFPSKLSFSSSREDWDQAYPAADNLIITFMGAPAPYPVLEKDKNIQKYIEWSDVITEFTSDYIEQHLSRPFVGIHLRNGRDWKRACEHIGEETDYPFMSSPQCVGYATPTRPFTKQMCFPSREVIIEQVLQVVKKTKAKSLFIATDKDSMKEEFKKAFQKDYLSVDVVQLNGNSLVNDLALLIESDSFIGNCGSSVTAFVVRKRNIFQRPSNFFGMSTKTPITEKNEL